MAEVVPVVVALLGGGAIVTFVRWLFDRQVENRRTLAEAGADEATAMKTVVDAALEVMEHSSEELRRCQEALTEAREDLSQHRDCNEVLKQERFRLNQLISELRVLREGKGGGAAKPNGVT